MMTNHKKTKKETEILNFCKNYCKKQDYNLNKNKKELRIIIKKLAENEKIYGLRYCPCRIITGDSEKDKKIICPCIYHKKEIKQQGHCLCRLFFK